MYELARLLYTVKQSPESPICVIFLWRQYILAGNLLPILEDGIGVQNQGKYSLCRMKMESYFFCMILYGLDLQKLHEIEH